MFSSIMASFFLFVQSFIGASFFSGTDMLLIMPSQAHNIPLQPL